MSAGRSGPEPNCFAARFSLPALLEASPPASASAARTPAEGPQSPDALWRARRRSSRRTGFDVQGQLSCIEHIEWRRRLGGLCAQESRQAKEQQKQKPQKTLKQRRSEKRAAKQFGSGPLLPADTSSLEARRVAYRPCDVRAVMRLGVRGDVEGCRHASLAADARRSAS